MDKRVYENLQIIWDYMLLNMELSKADCIVGFGSYNIEIATRAAELYKLGFSKKVLFSGGLGRNTEGRFKLSEAEMFAKIAIENGVTTEDIIVENKSTNTAENILFSKELLLKKEVKVSKIIAVHKPFMERRIYAALKVYWKEVEIVVASPNQTIEQYIEASKKQGLDEKTAIEVIVGDFQRIDVYAKKGYQIPQFIPQHVFDAYNILTNLGFTGQLAVNS